MSPKTTSNDNYEIIEFHAADIMDGEIIRAATFKNFRGAQAMRHSFRDA